MRARTVLQVLFIGIVFSRCECDDGITEPEVACIAITVGDEQSNNQTGVASTRLSYPIVVRIRRQSSRAGDDPTPGGVRIQWTTASPGTTADNVSVTDTAGYARTYWTLGPSPGQQELAAEASWEGRGCAHIPPVTFHATATTPPYRVLRIIGNSNNQTSLVGARLTQPLEVEYVTKTDTPSTETPAIAAAIVWTVETGGGSLTQATSITDLTGRARTEWTLGPNPGQQTVKAATPPFGSEPTSLFDVTFTATAASRALRIVSGNAQKDTVGARLAPVTVEYVELLDATGAAKAIDVATVTWSVLTGGGEVQPGSSTTDNSGRASANWTLGRTIGVQTLRASVPAVGNLPASAFQVDFEAEALLAPPPAPSRIAYARMDAASIAAGTADPAFAFNSATGAITVQSSATGRYDVTFPNLETPTGAATTVLVSSLGQGTTWCKLDTWRNGPNRSLLATVLCFERAVPAASEFTILALGDRVLPHRYAFAYGDRPSRTGPPYSPRDTASFSSSGQPITITPLASGGRYIVEFAGLARTAGSPPETVILTAAGSAAVRCGLSTDTSPLVQQSALVFCTDAATLTQLNTDAPFVMAVIERGRPGLRWGSAYNAGLEETTGTRTITQGHSSAGEPVIQTKLGIGRYDITFRGLARTAGTMENVQLTAATGRGDYCKLLGWQSVGVDLTVQVQCFLSDTLEPEDQDFTILIIQ